MKESAMARGILVMSMNFSSGTENYSLQIEWGLTDWLSGSGGAGEKPLPLSRQF
jgi:hypothetical protein